MDQLWDHEQITRKSDYGSITDTLIEYEEDGWELVAASYLEVEYITFFFKRPYKK